ncbi:MAG: hypothetical protein K2O34_14865 [Acetatifactor sp.]|nr:hypothetical protein [Acetatifactor sp.]
MNIKELQDTIIKTGICRYGSRQYRIFLCTSPVFPGTGDYEDGIGLYADREMDCFCIWLEDMLNANQICAGGGYYESLCEAIDAAENSSGFVGWMD